MWWPRAWCWGSAIVRDVMALQCLGNARLISGLDALEWLVGLLWAAWLLLLCVLETGEGKLRWREANPPFMTPFLNRLTAV